MEPWRLLGPELARIRAEEPGALQVSPGPDGLASQPLPFQVRLAGWAVAPAQRLHNLLGAEIELTVGLMRFPGCVPEIALRAPTPMIGTDPTEIRITTDHALEIRSGHRLETHLDVENRADRPLSITHHGNTLWGCVVEPQRGRVVSGYLGWAPLTADEISVIRPGRTARLLVQVFTWSRVPELGYAVPPGEWALRTRVRLAEGDRYSPPIPLRIRP